MNSFQFCRNYIFIKIVFAVEQEYTYLKISILRDNISRKGYNKQIIENLPLSFNSFIIFSYSFWCFICSLSGFGGKLDGRFNNIKFVLLTCCKLLPSPGWLFLRALFVESDIVLPLSHYVITQQKSKLLFTNILL